jgi:MscS family membrane protein
MDFLHPAQDSYLRNEFLGFSTLSLYILVGLAITIFATRFIAMRFFPTILRKIVRHDSIKEKTIHDSDKALGTAVGFGIAYILLDIVIQESLVTGSAVVLPSYIVDGLPGVIQFIVAISLVIWAYRLVEIIEDIILIIDVDGDLDGSEKTLISALQSVVRFIVVFVGAVFVADSLGFELTSLIAGLGISGLALALAAKDTISNFFGAVTVLLDRPFKVGDYILVDSVEGEVMEINLRTTLIRTSSDTVVTMPNANLVNTPVENFGKRRWRRWQTQLHFDINSDNGAIKSFCEHVVKHISENEFTLKEESSWCRVNAISALSLDVDVNLYWNITSGVQEREVREDFILYLMQLATELNLEFYDGRIRTQKS